MPTTKLVQSPASVQRLMLHAIAMAAERMVHASNTSAVARRGTLGVHALLQAVDGGYAVSMILEGNVTSPSLRGLLALTGVDRPSRSLVLQWVSGTPLPNRHDAEPVAIWRQRVSRHLHDDPTVQALIDRVQYAFSVDS